MPLTQSSSESFSLFALGVIALVCLALFAVVLRYTKAKWTIVAKSFVGTLTRLLCRVLKAVSAPLDAVIAWAEEEERAHATQLPNEITARVEPNPKLPGPTDVALSSSAIERNWDDAQSLVRRVQFSLDTTEQQTISQLAGELRVLPPEQLLDALGRWLLEHVDGLLWISVHAADWVNHEYRQVALIRGSQTLTPFGRDRTARPISEPVGVVASTFRSPYRVGLQAVQGVVIDFAKHNDRVLRMDERTESEATFAVLYEGRPVLVLNLESHMPERFTRDSAWVLPVRIAAQALGSVVVQLDDLWMPAERAILNGLWRESSAYMETPSGVRTILSRYARAGASITDADPELSLLLVCRPGSRDQCDFRLYGYHLARRFSGLEAEFVTGIETFEYDARCPTGILMEKASTAKKAGRKEPFAIQRKVDCTAPSCVPVGVPHFWYAFAPIVSDQGEWLGGCYLHFLRPDVNFDHFCVAQFERFAGQMALLFGAYTRRLHSVFAETGPLPRGRAPNQIVNFSI